MVYCGKCGAYNSDRSSYCRQCGEPLREPAAAESSPVQDASGTSDRTRLLFLSKGAPALPVILLAAILGLLVLAVWFGVRNLLNSSITNDKRVLFIAVVAVEAGGIGLLGALLHAMMKSWVALYADHLEGQLVDGLLAKPTLVQTGYDSIRLPEKKEAAWLGATTISIDGRRYAVYCHRTLRFRQVLRAQMEETEPRTELRPRPSAFLSIDRKHGGTAFHDQQSKD